MSKNICEKRLVCCVCNVSCLCPTSLTCNPMSRRRKEKDSLMRFVIVSIVPFSWLKPPLNLKPGALPPYSHLLVWIRQTGKRSLCTCLFQLPQFPSQTNRSAWGMRTGDSAKRAGRRLAFSPPPPSRKISQG